MYFSYHIAAFCRLIADAEKDYAWNQAEMKRLDALTQDYLHKLELGELDYRGRAKIATKIAECRKQRRACKDIVQLLEPVVSFLDTKNGRGAINSLKNVLGELRKIERYLNNAVYIPRVLGYDEYEEAGK